MSQNCNKVKRKAQIRNRYNQVLQLTWDTILESNNQRGIVALKRSPECLSLKVLLLNIVESFEQYKQYGVSY